MHFAHADERTSLAVLLTCAVLFPLSVVLEQEKPLGENHQKRANPAGDLPSEKEPQSQQRPLRRAERSSAKPRQPLAPLRFLLHSGLLTLHPGLS